VWRTAWIAGIACLLCSRAPRESPTLSSRTLFAMAAALTIRTLADIWTYNPAWALAGRIGGAVELGVVLIFALIITKTIRKSNSPMRHRGPSAA